MIWWIIAAICAFFVKGLCGFANSLVFSTILSFTTNNINISPVELMIGLPANVIMAIRERRSIKWGMSFRLIALVLAGNIPGMLLLKTADARVIKALFGAVIIAIGIEMLLRSRSQTPKQDSKAVLLVISIVSGLLCGLYGIGALMGAYVGRVTRDSHEFKANMAFVFTAENLFRLGMYAVLGIVAAENVLLAVKVLPFALLGLIIGMAAGMKLNERTAKMIVIVMLMISGASLMIANL